MSSFKRALTNVLSPALAADIEEIKDEEIVKKEYKYWRWRIFYSIFIGYVFFYITRKSFTFAMPGLIQDLGFDKSHLGILATVLYVTYGISKFTSGILADIFSPRYFMSIGLILTGVMNIFFGFSSSILMFAVFWGLNGWFQGFGSPPCARLLTYWYSQRERGGWWSCWNVSHNVGAFLIPLIVALCIEHLGWRWAMFLPGLMSIAIGVLLYDRLRSTPQSLGLPPIEKFRNDYGSSDTYEVEDNLSAKEILFRYVLFNKYMWMLGIAYFFVYIVRTGANDWTALYLQESKGYSLLGANACVSAFEVGGFFGSLAAGWASDKIWDGRRGPPNVVFIIGAALGVLIFFLAPPGYSFVDSAAMFLIGFFIFGPQMLVGMAAVDLAPKRAAATATGFAGAFAYAGAAAAGYPLGKIIQDMGWEAFFWALAISCGIAFALLLPLWATRAQTKKEVPAVAPEPAAPAAS